MKEETEFVPAGSAGGSVEMRNKRHRNNFIKADGLIEKREELIFVIIKFILAICKNICQRELFMCYHVSATPLLANMDNCYLDISIGYEVQ